MAHGVILERPDRSSVMGKGEPVIFLTRVPGPGETHLCVVVRASQAERVLVS